MQRSCGRNELGVVRKKKDENHYGWPVVREEDRARPQQVQSHLGLMRRDGTCESTQSTIPRAKRTQSNAKMVSSRSKGETS